MPRILCGVVLHNALHVLVIEPMVCVFTKELTKRLKWRGEKVNPRLRYRNGMTLRGICKENSETPTKEVQCS